MAKTNKIVNKMVIDKLRNLLLEGNFPDVNYEETGMWKSYDLMSYTNYHSRIGMIVHSRLQGAGYPQGLFSTRLSNATFVNIAKNIVKEVTPEAILDQNQRLRTMFD